MLTVGFVPLRKSLPVMMHLFSLQHLQTSNRVGLARTLYRRLIVDRSVDRADRIIVNSRFAAEQVLRAFPRAAARLTISYEGMQHEQFTSARPGGRGALAAEGSSASRRATCSGRAISTRTNRPTCCWPPTRGFRPNAAPRTRSSWSAAAGTAAWTPPARTPPRSGIAGRRAFPRLDRRPLARAALPSRPRVLPRQPGGNLWPLRGGIHGLRHAVRRQSHPHHGRGDGWTRADRRLRRRGSPPPARSTPCWATTLGPRSPARKRDRVGAARFRFRPSGARTGRRDPRAPARRPGSEMRVDFPAATRPFI